MLGSREGREMEISEKGLEFIAKWEGFSGSVYKDVAGFPTIGFGHLIRKGEDFSGGISRENALVLLRKDVEKAERSLRSMVRVELAQNQFDVLVSFIFNLGGGAFQRSTLRRVVNRREFVEVPRELNRWVYAGGRRVKGLVNRRREEGIIFSQLPWLYEEGKKEENA